MNKPLAIVLPIVVLAGGFALAGWFITTAPETPKAAATREVTLVDVVVAEQTTATVDVEGMGNVVAARVVQLKSEVVGRVVWVNPNLVQGGRVEKGELLFRIDDRDYKLAVDQQTSALQRARFELAQERGRVRVAEREWKVMGDSAPSTPEGKALALRLPQLKSAQAALASAESGLELAKLNVERTRVRASFAAFVQSEQIEIGQLVDRQTVLATLVGTDEFWVQASIPVADLRWIVQADAEGEGGSTATIRQRLAGGDPLTVEGQLVRLAGDLDPRGRMARVIISVKNPMDVGDGKAPLLLGAYVEADIHGLTLESIIALPRRAVRADDRVWIMQPDGTLGFRRARVVHRGRDQVFIDGGVLPGDQVVVSRISSPVRGMPLRVPDAPEANENSSSPEALEALPSMSDGKTERGGQ